MNGQEFKAALANPKNVYCLVSIDSEMIDLYAGRFKNAIHADLVSYGQIKPYGKLFKKKTLNILYMPKLDESIFDRREFIFVYTDSIDKRSSVYKKHADQIIEIQNDYTEYIMRNSNMSEAMAKQFAKANNNDLGRIKSGLNVYKLSDSRYNRFTDYSSDIYLWVDNFIKRAKLPRIDESAISVMALLSTNVQNILKVKQKDTIGMNPFLVKRAKDLEDYITVEEAVQIINDCFYLDSQIKKGLIDADYTLDYLKVRRYSNGITN